jgi:hypothetical protein
LRRKKGHLKGLTVALCGDLKFGRTVHSLIYALARFGANIVAVPTSGMDVPDYVLERLAAERSYSFSTVTMDELKSLAGGLDALYLTPSAPHQMALFTGAEAIRRIPAAEPPAALDAFYVTRLQKERMSGKEAGAADYVRFDARALRTSRTHEAVVMHPLPRTGLRARYRPARGLLRAGGRRRTGPDGADRLADGEGGGRIHRSAARGQADSLQGRAAAAMLESELHHAIRGSVPGAALHIGTRRQCNSARAEVRILRA